MEGRREGREGGREGGREEGRRHQCVKGQSKHSSEKNSH